MKNPKKAHLKIFLFVYILLGVTACDQLGLGGGAVLPLIPGGSSGSGGGNQNILPLVPAFLTQKYQGVSNFEEPLLKNLQSSESDVCTGICSERVIKLIAEELIDQVNQWAKAALSFNREIEIPLSYSNSLQNSQKYI